MERHNILLPLDEAGVKVIRTTLSPNSCNGMIGNLFFLNPNSQFSIGSGHERICIFPGKMRLRILLCRQERLKRQLNAFWTTNLSNDSGQVGQLVIDF